MREEGKQEGDGRTRKREERRRQKGPRWRRGRLTAGLSSLAGTSSLRRQLRAQLRQPTSEAANEMGATVYRQHPPFSRSLVFLFLPLFFLPFPLRCSIPKPFPQTCSEFCGAVHSWFPRHSLL